MTHTWKISYIGCQTCQARVHCAECEKMLSEMLMRLEGIQAAVVEIAKKQLMVEVNIDCDLLEEAMEDIGIFVG
ncbi:MAG: cation transporter [Faecousia sp.]